MGKATLPAITRILLVEDSPSDAILVKRALSGTPERSAASATEGHSLGKVVVDHAETLAEAKALLAERRYAAIITDYKLPDGDGLALQQHVAELGLDIPLIMSSGAGDDRAAAEVMKRGGSDYIVKSEESIAALPLTLSQALQRHELQLRNRWLTQIVEQASDSILTTDLQGNILTANRAVERDFGYSPEEMLGQTIRQLFPPELNGGTIDQMLTAAAAGKAWEGELIARRRSRSVFPVHMTASLLRDPRGHPEAIIGIARDITERRELLEQLRRLSITDDLTGLFNYRYFRDRLRYEFLRAVRYSHPLSCMMADLDYFKSVNDVHGHQVGDEVLKAVARKIVNATRSVDIVTRYGGEEFAIILPNTDEEDTVRCAEKIWADIGNAPILRVRGGDIYITVSIGVAGLSPELRDEDQLLHRADSCLLMAKNRGRNNICYWREIRHEFEKCPDEATTVQIEDLRARLRELGRSERRRYISAVRNLLRPLEKREPHRRDHSVRVAAYAVELAKLAGEDEEKLEQIRAAALLHDIGLIAVPSEILCHPGSLSEEQMNLIKSHSAEGATLAAELHLFRDETELIRHHHERYDGKGYPDALAGEEIPLGARILAIADAFDAMLSDRPFRKRLSREKAMEELRRNAGSQFDPSLVELFLKWQESNP